MDSTIGIKVPTNTTAVAKCISIIREYTTFPIGKIKKSILNNDYLLCYDYTDEVGIKALIECYEKLNSEKINAQLYEHGRPCEISFLHNLLGMYEEIEKESPFNLLD